MTGDPTASTDVTDNSGFVDHLRLVHFTLLAACLIMWIAVSYQPPSSAARAYEQTNQLLHLKDTWDGGRWLRNFLSEQRAKTDGRMGTTWQAAAVEWVYPSPLLPVSEENRVQMIDLGNSHFVLANASIPTSMVSNTSSIDENTYSPIQEKEQGLFLLIRDSSSNLGNYIRIWNQLYSFHYLVHIEKIHGGWGLIDGLDPNHRSVKVFVTIEDSQVNTDRIRDPRSRTISPGLLLREDLIQLLRSGPYGPEKTDAIVAAVRGAGGSVELEPQSDPLKEAYEKLLQLVSNDKETQCFLFDRQTSAFARAPVLLLRAECASERVPLQSSLMDGVLPAPPLGKFSRSFPDVDDLAKHLRALSLDDLQTFFLAEKNRSEEKIELPGFKLPGAAVTSWGVFVILIIEGYLFVIFRDLRHRLSPNDKAWSVPWIGISPDLASRIGFLVSMMFVLSTVGYLVWHGISLASQISSKAIYGSQLVLSSLLCCAILYYNFASINIKRRGESSQKQIPDSPPSDSTTQ